MTGALTGTLEALATRAAPALVWHGSDGERIELSGRVFTTWVAKTSHLLAEELDVGPGSLVAVDLGSGHLHWRGLVIATAAWVLGADVRFPGDPGTGEAPDVIALPGDADVEQADADDVLAVALPGLAMRLPGPPPAQALDYVAEVRAFPDAFPFPATTPVDSLLAHALDGHALGSPLLEAGRPVTRDDAVAALAVLAAGGSIGLTDLTDPARRLAIAEQEGLSVP